MSNKRIYEKIDKEEFILRAKKIHNYNYDDILFKGYYKVVENIKCSIHGYFSKKGSNHLTDKKSICTKCRITEEFITKSKNKYGNNSFDYSNVIYTYQKNPVNLICKNHGSFNITPKNHLGINFGCLKCSEENVRINKKKFIERATKIHDNKYDYSSVKDIQKQDTKIIIKCPIHGNFNQYVYNHLKGNGCKKCSNKKINLNMFLKRARKIHGDIYDYSHLKENDIKGNGYDIVIKCKTHGDFKQRISHHTRGVGCPSCSESKGERKVRNYLNNKKIKFISEKRISFMDKNYRYDFYIPEKNLYIEYDGEQHFKKTGKTNYMSYGFAERIKDDKWKTMCIIHKNASLLRIHYNDDISKTLDKYIPIITDKSKQIYYSRNDYYKEINDIYEKY